MPRRRHVRPARAPAPTRRPRTARRATTATPARRPTPARAAPAREQPGHLHGLGSVPPGRHVRPEPGACSNPTATDGTSCNDGNACTQTDTCQAGTCTGSNPSPARLRISATRPGPATQHGICSNPAGPTAPRAPTAPVRAARVRRAWPTVDTRRTPVRRTAEVTRIAPHPTARSPRTGARPTRDDLPTPTPSTAATRVRPGMRARPTPPATAVTPARRRMPAHTMRLPPSEAGRLADGAASNDGGRSRFDAGEHKDARAPRGDAASTDGALADGADAGPQVTASGDGCSCHVAGGQGVTDPRGLQLLVAAIATVSSRSGESQTRTARGHARERDRTRSTATRRSRGCRRSPCRDLSRSPIPWPRYAGPRVVDEDESTPS